MREVKPEVVGDAVPKPPGESIRRKGGAAVDEEARAAAEEVAVSSLSSSLVFREGTGDGRRPGTVGECVAGPWDRESTTDRSSSCFCWMAWSWLMTSSNVVPGGRPWDAIIDGIHGLLQQVQCLSPLSTRRGSRGQCMLASLSGSARSPLASPNLKKKKGRGGKRRGRRETKRVGCRLGTQTPIYRSHGQPPGRQPSSGRCRALSLGKPQKPRPLVISTDIRFEPSFLQRPAL